MLFSLAICTVLMMPSRLFFIGLFFFFFRAGICLDQHAATLLGFAEFGGDFLADFFDLIGMGLGDQAPARRGVNGAYPRC